MRSVRYLVKCSVVQFCYCVCSLTGHRNGCVIIQKGGVLYSLLEWSLRDEA